MTPVIHIECAEGVEAPDDDSFSLWVSAALNSATPSIEELSTAVREAPELSIRVTGNEEMADLNQQYRGKSGPTNVLSFPTDFPPDVETGLLGDIVICAPRVLEEAAAQNKPVAAHWAHLTIHGVLHLLGHDHIYKEEAEAMETLEISTLSKLGYPDPYQAVEHSPEGGKVAS